MKKKNRPSPLHQILHYLHKGIPAVITVFSAVLILILASAILRTGQNQTVAEGVSLLESLQAEDVGTAVQRLRNLSPSAAASEEAPDGNSSSESGKESSSSAEQTLSEASSGGSAESGKESSASAEQTLSEASSGGSAESEKESSAPAEQTLSEALSGGSAESEKASSAPAEQALSDVSSGVPSVSENSTETAAADSFIAQYTALLDSQTVPAYTDAETIGFRQHFSDTVFFGDSMTQAIATYGIAAEDRVIFERGGTIPTLLPKLAEVQNIYPARIVIWTGLNDCNHYMSDYEQYASDLASLLQTAGNIVGINNVYVCSLLPASDAVAASRADLALAPTYNLLLEQTAAVCGAHYIDTTWIVRQRNYLEDGIHMDQEFYAVWARYLELVIP